MRGLLLGYLLNALEPEERQRVEDRIERDANLERELELFAESLQPLQAAEGPIPLPAGLADRTCHLVAEHAAGRRGASAAAVGRSALPAERMPRSISQTAWSRGRPTRATSAAPAKQSNQLGFRRRGTGRRRMPSGPSASRENSVQ